VIFRRFGGKNVHMAVAEAQALNCLIGVIHRPGRFGTVIVNRLGRAGIIGGRLDGSCSEWGPGDSRRNAETRKRHANHEFAQDPHPRELETLLQNENEFAVAKLHFSVHGRGHLFGGENALNWRGTVGDSLT
jgi:hypothetical protein